jgi:NTP pyrophosphatase (non-canonical NTP hydrolase)
MFAELSFGLLRSVNFSRAGRWHPGFPQDDLWSGADWSNAMCGEAGEAANVVKKLRRYETGTEGKNDPPRDQLVAMLADECADTVIYLDLLAAKYGIDLGAAVIHKFNLVSNREGFPEHLRSVTDG